MIEWFAVSEKWPPIGEWVLTACSGKSWPDMQTNALREGDGKFGRTPGLFFWDSGDDFDAVTHWAPLPAMPNAEVRGASRLAGEASSAEGATSTVVLGHKESK